MSHYHAVVWIDHLEAHILQISHDDVESSLVKPKNPPHKVHSKAATLGSGRAPEDQDYYHRVTEALAGATEILIVGPAQAKLQLVKHIHTHDPALVSKVAGVESVDHPTDKQLVAYARKYFLAKDQVL